MLKLDKFLHIAEELVKELSEEINEDQLAFIDAERKILEFVNKLGHFLSEKVLDKVEKEDVGYSAYCIELEGCLSQGDTMEDLQANLHEVLNLCLDEPSGSNLVFPSLTPLMRMRKMCSAFP